MTQFVKLAVDGVGPAEPKRWHIMAILIAQEMINTVQWISLAPVALQTSVLYSVDIQLVNTLSAICLFLFPPGMLLCSYLSKTTGLRTTILFASGLNLLSAFFRVISYPLIDIIGGRLAYSVLLLGQIAGAFAQPICTNTPVRVANDWFAQAERDFATGFGNIGFGLGQLVAMSLPGIMVGKEATDTDGIGQMLVLESALAVAAFFWCFRCFEEEPALPPSRAAAEKRRMRQEDRLADSQVLESLRLVLQEYKSLIQDKNFCFLLIAFSIGLGGFNALFTDMEQLIKPAGYNSRDSSIVGIVFILGGAVVGPMSALALDRTHAYNSFLKVCFVATIVTGFNFFFQIQPNNHLAILLSAATFGASSIPILPIALAVSAEVTYPIQEEASTGMLICGGNYIGVVFTYTFAALLQKTPTYQGPITPAAILIVVFLLLANVFSLSFHGTYKRQMAEIERKRTLSNASEESVKGLQEPFLGNA